MAQNIGIVLIMASISFAPLEEAVAEPADCKQASPTSDVPEQHHTYVVASLIERKRKTIHRKQHST